MLLISDVSEGIKPIDWKMGGWFYLRPDKNFEILKENSMHHHYTLKKWQNTGRCQPLSFTILLSKSFFLSLT